MTTVSTSAFYQSALTNMNALTSQVDALQTSVATGNKYSDPSQAPVATAQTRTLQLADALSTADAANADAAKTSLSLSDSTLSSVSNIVTQVQTLATQAASGTLNDTQRADIGTQIAALSTELNSLANTKDSNGRAIFGGTASGAAYTVDSSGNATYNGTSSASTLSLGAGLSVTTGVTGPQVFSFTNADGSQGNLLSVVANLATALQGTGSSGTTPQEAASSALDQLSSGLNQVTSAQTMVGARENWVTTTTSIASTLSTQRSQTESDLTGTDLTTAVSQLQNTMTVLEAAQSSFVKVSSMSLFSLLQ